MTAQIASATKRQELAALMAHFPVGTRVRHLDESQGHWTGTVTPDSSGDHPGHTIGTAPAHAVVGTLNVVHVEPDAGTCLAPMWINVDWLGRLGVPVPARPVPRHQPGGTDEGERRPRRRRRRRP